jgi:hypothetical protein
VDGSAVIVSVPPARPRKVKQADHQPRPQPRADERALAGAVECEPSSAVSLERPSSARGPRVAVLLGHLPFTHAADYRWLVGCLQHDPEHDSWSVRYGLPGEPDLYDGLLDLVNSGPMTGFQAGRMVHVEGELVDPAPLEIKPVYRILSLQVLRQ